MNDKGIGFDSDHENYRKQKQKSQTSGTA